MKFLRVAYKLFCYTFAAACVANLALLGVSLIIERRVVQYRVPDTSAFATELYYNAIDDLTNALVLLAFVWFPFSLLMLTLAGDRPMPLFTKIGIAAFLAALIILRVDPFGIWFYVWD